MWRTNCTLSSCAETCELVVANSDLLLADKYSARGKITKLSWSCSV